MLKVVTREGVAEGVGVVSREVLGENLAQSLAEALPEGLGVVSRECLAESRVESLAEGLSEGVVFRKGG